MGDYLYSRAVIELVRLDDLEPLRVLSRVTNEMTVGEMRQLLAHEPLEFSEEAYDLLIQAKTASLLSGACEVGALRAAPGERAALRRYGEALGMAFQIVDDLLDYVGDPSVTGKPTGSDLREHKVTLPLIAALPRMDAAGRGAGGRPHGQPRSPTTRRSPRSSRRWPRPAASTTPASGRSGWRSRPTASSTRCPRRPLATRSGRASPTSWIAGADGRPTSSRVLPRHPRGGVHCRRGADGAAPADPPRQRRPDLLHQHLDGQFRPCLGRSSGGKLHPGADRPARLACWP